MLWLVGRLVVGNCVRDNNVCLLEGTTVFDDAVAASFSEYDTISCTTAPCQLDLPGDRVIPGVTTVAGVTIEGGTAYFECSGTEFSVQSTTGKMSISNCESVSILDSTLDVDIAGAVVDGTFLDGSTVKLSDGASGDFHLKSGTGTVQLSGSTAVLTGSAWTVEGTGSIDISEATSVVYGSSTAGLTMLDWGWLKNKNLVLKEFANKPPLPVEFNDQEVVVDPGGWIDGATIKGSSVSGAVGYAPKIESSTVFSNVQFGTAFVADSVLDVTMHSRFEPVFFNNASGRVTVANKIEFVNAWVPDDQTLDLSGDFYVDCPDCGRTFPLDERPAEPTDLFAKSPDEVGTLDLKGKTIVIGHTQSAVQEFESRRARRTPHTSCTLALTNGITIVNALPYDPGANPCNTTHINITLVPLNNLNTDRNTCGNVLTINGTYVAVVIKGGYVKLENVIIGGTDTIILDSDQPAPTIVLNGIIVTRVKNLTGVSGNQISPGRIALSKGLMKDSTPGNPDFKAWTNSVPITYVSAFTGDHTDFHDAAYLNGQVSTTLLAGCDIDSQGEQYMSQTELAQVNSQYTTNNELPVNSCVEICIQSQESIDSNKTKCTPDDIEIGNTYGYCTTDDTNGRVYGPFFSTSLSYDGVPMSFDNNQYKLDFVGMENRGFGTNPGMNPVLAVFINQLFLHDFDCRYELGHPGCIVANFVSFNSLHTIHVFEKKSTTKQRLYYMIQNMPDAITINVPTVHDLTVFIVFTTPPSTTVYVNKGTNFGSVTLECGISKNEQISVSNSVNLTSFNTDYLSTFGSIGFVNSEPSGTFPLSSSSCTGGLTTTTTSTTTTSSSPSPPTTTSSAPSPSPGPSQSSSSSSDHKETAIIVGSVMGGVAVLFGIIAYLIWRRNNTTNDPVTYAALTSKLKETRL